MEQTKELIRLKNLLAPHTKRAYFVGGAVRDSILKIPTNDYDIEVYDIAPNMFEDLMRSVGAKGVGRDFLVYKLGNIDVSLPRSEKKSGVGHSAFDVKWCNDPVLASRRRDFSINSIMINIFDNSTLDLNSGIKDLKAKLIVHIDDKSFVEDSLRVLRAVQFSARFGFKIAPETIKLCRSIDLSDLNKERIWAEFEKLLNAKYPLYGVYYLFKLGVAKKLFGLEKCDLMLLRWVYRSPAKDILFLLRWRFRVRSDEILSAINAPKKVARDLMRWNLAPKKPTAKFLLATALKGALKDYPPVSALRLQNFAKKLAVYESGFIPKTAPSDLMARGFKGRELGKKLKLETLKEIRSHGRK